MVSRLGSAATALAQVCVTRLKGSQRARQGLRLIFVALVLAGPRSWRDASWCRWHETLRWNWLSLDRPPRGPGWLDRKILDRALSKLGSATGDDRLLLLHVIMQCAHACDSGWYPDFTDPVLLRNHEIMHYLFTFPIFIDSVTHQERIVGFIQRLFGDLDHLHAASLDPAVRAEVAGHVARVASFMPAVFSDAALRPLARAAGRWLETHLRLSGHCLDHVFPPRAARTRLLVGVFVQDIQPRNESFLVLPFGLGLDRDRFEPVLVTGRPPPDDAFGVLVGQAFERVVVVAAEHLHERVATLRALDLDFLILGNTIVGQTSELLQLYAHRLARWQIMPVAIWPTTTGLAATDSVLTSANTEPRSDAEAHYSEAVSWLDGTFNCFAFGPDDPRLAPASALPASLSPNKPIVFASGGVIHKLGPALRRSFIRILQRVPESELLLYPFNPNWLLNPKLLALRETLLDEFAMAGIARERVRILPAMTPADILQMMRGVTVYLDTFPFSGGASVLEPIFAGCPVVTLRGRNQRGLLGAGMMRALDMDELVAEDIAGYETMAVEIARSPARRAELAERLRHAAATAPFLDTAQFGRHLGDALKMLSQRQRDNQACRKPERSAGAELLAPSADHSAPSARMSMQALYEHVRKLGLHPDCIIDLGAAYGDFTRMAARIVPEARFLLFEPLEEYTTPLRRVLSEVPNCHLVMAAAADTPGSMIIHVHDDLFGSSLMDEWDEPAGVNGTPREVPVTTVDLEVAKLGWPGDIWCKIDVQGAELKVLAGAEETLRRTALLVVETNLFNTFTDGPLAGEVIAHMTERGFVLYDIAGFLYRPLDGALMQLDLVFVPKHSALRRHHGFATPEQRHAITAYLRSRKET